MGKVDLTGDVIEPELGRHILDELANLNAGFLDLAGEPATGIALLPQEQAAALANLSRTGRRRLANCAFALFDLQLGDLPRWRTLERGTVNDGLRESENPGQRDVSLFSLSALMYLRHLAEVNRFFARLSFGASGEVLQIVSALPISRLREIADCCPGLLQSRFATRPEVWAELLRLARRIDAEPILPAAILGFQHTAQRVSGR